MIVCCLLAVGRGDGGFAQEAANPAKLPERAERADSPPTTSQKPAAPSVPEELPPLHLFDKEGVLVPVPGVTLEEFQRLLVLKGQMEGRQVRPRFSLQSLHARGKAVERKVEIEFKFTVLITADDWVRIPLRLGQAILTTDPAFEGEGEHFLDFEEEEGGHVCWIRAAAGSSHTITLQAIAPLETGGEETRLRLSAPRASLSEFQLELPMIAAGKVAGGAALDEPEVDRERGQTLFKARRLDREFELAWWQADSADAAASVDLESSGEIAVRVDGRGLRWNADLMVRSLAGEFTEFRVKLPTGAELQSIEQSGYTVETLPNPTEDDAARIATVRFERPTVGPVTVRLQAGRSASAEPGGPTIDLSGFEVLDAPRQWGYLAIHSVGDWEVLWGEDIAGARRVENVPDALRREDLIAAFEYIRQPFALPARIVPRASRISIDPEYVFFAAPKETRLAARWRCAVRGAKAYSVEIDLPGWIVDEVGPGNLVNLDSIITSRTNPLTIPLLQPATGQFEITLQAHRPLPSGAQSLDIVLPAPRANAISPPAIVVLPDDNVELKPRVEAMTGMTRQRIAPDMTLPKRQQAPLFYRGEGPQAQFVADFVVHPRSVTAAVTSRITLSIGPEAGDVEQRLAFHIAHEPLSVIALLAPPPVADTDELRVTLDGQPLSPRVVAEDAASGAARRMLVELPTARIGAVEILVRFSIPPVDVTPGSSTKRPIPLVMPADCAVERNELAIVTARGVRVMPRGDGWKPLTGTGNGSPASEEMRLTADGSQSTFECAIEGDPGPTLDTTILEKAWIQSWLTENGRVDRAVFRFLSRDASLAITLPEGASGFALAAWLDEKPIDVSGISGRSLVVPLPPGQEERQHLLELRYRFDRREPRNGWLALAAPQVVANSQLQQTYWQVVLPSTEHFGWCATDWTLESVWRWTGYAWARRAPQDQARLEAWIGAPSRTPPSDATNQYLFSSVGPFAALRIRTADRGLLVFSASLAALVIGLALIYLPVARSGGALLTVAIVLIATGLLLPDPLVLVLQAASVGVVLAVLAAGLERVVGRRRGKHRVIRHPAGSSIDRRRIDSEQRVALGPPPSTVTAEAAAEVMASQGRS